MEQRPELVKILAVFYGTPKVISDFPEACHWNLPGSK
jgi:hypothetical protein